MQNAPILSPEVTREIALADDHRADVGLGGVFQQVVDGVAAEDLDPLALHDLRNRVADLHGIAPLCLGILESLGRGFHGGNRGPAEEGEGLCPLDLHLGL
jgi:hypothetical protein